MVLFTMITRLRDSLPLAASMQNDEETERSLMEYQQQAKMLFRRLTVQSPPQCSIETAGPYIFHYLIDSDVVYLTLCDKNFSKKLSFTYLDDLALEFQSQFGKKVHTVTRPYCFIEFDTYIQKARKNVMDSRSRRNLGALNTELQDVQRIMVQNIDDVINRGAVLSEIDGKAANLSMLSAKYKKDATFLNWKSAYAKAAAVGVLFFVVILYVWIL